MSIRSTELTAMHNCPTYKKNQGLFEELRGKQTLQIKKAVFMKSKINEGLYGGKTVSEIEKETTEFFDSLDMETEQTRKQNEELVFSLMKRYLECETRTPVPAYPETIDVGNMKDIKVCPNLVFFEKCRPFERKTLNAKGRVEKYTSFETCIEVVRLFTGRPSVSQSGSKIDRSVAYCKDMYCLLLYGRKIAVELLKKNGLPENTPVTIVASYYYLRKKSDSAEHFEDDFFNIKGDGNIVSLSDIYYPNYTAKNDIDDHYIPQFDSYAAGTSECTAEDCERCPNKRTCYFQKAPIFTPEEEKKKEVSYMKFTKSQLEVIRARGAASQPMFFSVVAGPGSGKSTTISRRNAALVDSGEDPKKIFCTTFTNNGAAAFSEKTQMILDDLCCEAEGNIISTTFHSFGQMVIQERYQEFGFTQPPMLTKVPDKMNLVKKVICEFAKAGKVIEGLDYMNFDMNMFNAVGVRASVAKMFDVIKSNDLAPCEEDFARLRSETTFCLEDSALELVFEMYDTFQDRMYKKNLIEYADQERLLLNLIRRDPYYFEERFGFEHIVVDEAQDCNDAQLEILKCLIDHPNFKDLMVVGDDWQSIYKFRGANVNILIKLQEKLHAPVKQINMMENFRSTKTIVDFNNKYIDFNQNKMDKQVIPVRPEGKPVEVTSFWEKQELDSYIIDTIHDVLSRGYNADDIFIIAPKRTDLLHVGTLLTENGISYITRNPEKYMDNSRVQLYFDLVDFYVDRSDTNAAMNYLSMINGNDLLNIFTEAEVLSMIDELDHQMDVISQEADDLKKTELFFTLADRILEVEPDEIFEAFLRDMKARVIAGRNNNFTDIIEYSQLYEKYGENEEKKREKKYKDMVSLITAHSSKGLENKVVIVIADFHSKDLPDFYQKSNGTHMDDIEEKRRVFFVACTRAEDELYITGRKIAYGRKATRKNDIDTYVFNGFLQEAYQVAGKFFDKIKPVKKKVS